jgi:hypothetical protein
MAMDTKPKYSPDAGIGVEFSAKIVRVAIAFHSVTTAGSAATGGSA